MFSHYIKLAFRRFVKDKVYAAINLVGLSLAVAFSFLFVLWVQYENNFESTHKHRKQIYRVMTVENIGGEIVKRATTPTPLGAELVQEFPAIANATLFHIHRFPDVMVYNEQPYSVEIGETNNQFFEVFSYEFLQGSPQTAFKGERPIVLSEDFAKRIFGKVTDNIIGQPVYDRYRLWDVSATTGAPYFITAVVRVPQNTHIQFDVLVDAGGGFGSSWKSNSYTTFVKMASNAAFNNDTRALLANYLTKRLPDDNRKLIFQPFSDIHLNPDVTDTNLSGEFGESRYIFIFLTMAVFILAIAIINYINLSIARGSNRSKEAGIRKVEGAYRHELIVQFLVESMIWAFMAMFLALLLAEALIPWFSRMLGVALHIDYSLRTILTVIGLSLFTGLLAGSYSAFYLSAFHPTLCMKGGSITGSKSALRKTLLAVQLGISIFILLCTGIVYRQLNYIQDKDIGFDRDNVIGINTGLWYGVDGFKKEVLKNANVEAVSIATYSPIEMNWNATLNWDGKNSVTDEACNLIWCDLDYAKVFRMKIVQGSFLQEDIFLADEIVLNESAAKIIGNKDIIGSTVSAGKVAGVVKDFHFKSFQDKITPLIMTHSHETEGKVFIRISPYNQKATLDYIKGVFQMLKTDSPFEYFSMEDEYRNLYRKEYRLGRVFLYFSLLSIFISCMGVFSLVAFMVKQRSKEIALRKINGAVAADIVALFAREFSTLTIVAFIIAMPIAWLSMSRWLQGYHYRTGISWWIFVGVLALILALTLLSLIIQVFRAARRNPVEQLQITN